MPPENPESDNEISGAEPEERAPSLREIAEAAYDDLSDDNDEPDAGDDDGADRGDGRTRRGRFASNKETTQTGEADPEGPSPDKAAETQTQPDPALGSNQPPEHWSAEDKATFAKLPDDAKGFFMRRYTEMEADYTRKSQANAGAVQVVTALEPIFQDPAIVESMKELNFHPVQAIMDWARLHKGAVSQEPRVRAAILYEIAERMGFDPAKVFTPFRPGSTTAPALPAGVEKDPVVQYFADQASRTAAEMQALRNDLQRFQNADRERGEQQILAHTTRTIDSYADEKGADGKPVRPYFDKVLPVIIDLFKANPQRDLHQAYEQACWADPEVRKELIAIERNQVAQQRSNDRAKMAARGNTRGITSPVSKPSPEKKSNGKLRDVIDASADEVGF